MEELIVFAFFLFCMVLFAVVFSADDFMYSNLLREKEKGDTDAEKKE